MPHPIYLIAACDSNRGIGINGNLPWRIKDDLHHFHSITTKTHDPAKQNMVIMGRKTWESLPEKHRPLSRRKNIILTRDSNYGAPGASTTDTIEDAIKAANIKSIEQIFIIGGGSIYEKSINMPEITGIYLTEINKSFNCDTYFPPIPSRFNHHQIIGEGTENNLSYTYNLYKQSSNI